jgi:hypothetical protein
VIAHVAGAPVEELLVPVLSGAGGGLLLARAWVAARLRRIGGRRVVAREQPGDVAGDGPFGRVVTGMERLDVDDEVGDVLEMRRQVAFATVPPAPGAVPDADRTAEVARDEELEDVAGDGAFGVVTGVERFDGDDVVGDGPVVAR